MITNRKKYTQPYQAPSVSSNQEMVFSRHSSCPAPKPSSYFRYKIYLGRFCAVLLLIPGLPIIAILVLLTKLTSSGPGIFKQVRVGKDGKLFVMYKIRTMVLDAEKNTGAVWASKSDPRITGLGKILRKLHLDEFPQLINVVKGDMTLVGPRPERPEFVSILDREIDGYTNRLKVPPGVTGFAQLNLPADEVIADVRRKIALDFEYIEQASVCFDFLLVLATLGRAMKFSGFVPLKMLNVYRNVKDSSWAKHVGAIPGSERGALVSLDQLFEKANLDRLEKINTSIR